MKLTPADCLKIRLLRKQGLSYAKIAKRFHINTSSVRWHCIKKTKKTYRRVGDGDCG